MATQIGRRYGVSVITLVALGAIACFDFHLEGPEDPDPLPLPRVVSVSVEYRQPSTCVNTTTNCADKVVFFGSWMHPGAARPPESAVGWNFVISSSVPHAFSCARWIFFEMFQVYLSHPR